MDALSALLQAIRLRGSAFIDATLTVPWCVRTPPPEEIAVHLAPRARRIVPYHYVTAGRCLVQLPERAAVLLGAGDAVIFPHGTPHILASRAGLVPQPITTASVARLTTPGAVARVDYGGGGWPPTRLICGFFACDEFASEPLLMRLPALLRVRSAAAAQLLPATLAHSRQAGSLGSSAMLSKLSELLFVEALRAHLEALPSADRGLAALRDAYVGRALALVYTDPLASWTLPGLASAVGLSRSAFTERFVRTVGVSPMQYLAGWRLRLAAEALACTDRTVKEVADSTGFGSAEAFSRAFRREFGTAPARWRRRYGPFGPAD